MNRTGDSAPRYALYLAPPPEAPLWRFGSKVLGYDAATGEAMPGFAPGGYSASQWEAVVARPRLYGFHATLKAPFRLAPGVDRATLMADLSAFAARRQGFDLGPLAVACIRGESDAGFAALTEITPSVELAALERDAVMQFEPHRAPATPAEIARRQPDRLTERQRQSLTAFGYPFVGPDYRFHMTLSGMVEDAEAVADSLAEILANQLGTVRLQVDAIVLFEQPAPSAPFRIIQRASFSRPA
jgi:hypothetical protein